MQKGSFTARSSAYLDALTQEIEKKLQRAPASASQRRNLLQELFADMALEVDDRTKDIILSGQEDVISSAEDAAADQLCFYDLLADYYVSVSESGKRILHLIVQLWSQSFASHIFALLFHEWLSWTILKYFYVTHLLLFKDQRDLFLLLARFKLFYNADDMLEEFLKHSPVFPNAFLIGSPGDFFVIELADQLQKLKVEPVLLHYLSQIKVLQGMKLRMTTSTRLKACLYNFTSPVGPMYPTRSVRHAAGCIRFSFLSWTISPASYKFVLSISVSLVLAVLLLELCNVLHKGHLLFYPEAVVFWLGQDKRTKETLNI